MTRRVVFLSAFHDYRTPKRASVHALAAACVRLGHEVSFVSTRFSRLSRRTGDSRLFLWERAGRIERFEGVDCYLWRTPAHPFAHANPVVRAAMGAAFPVYAELPDATFDAIVRAADDVIIESSVAAIYVPRIKRLNPAARVIYFATDRLDTHGAHPAVMRRLIAVGPSLHHASLRARALASEFQWMADRLYLAPFGVDPADFADIGPSPYADPVNGVSVGSGLFDPDYFLKVAPRFPDVRFHVIGCGQEFAAPANVVVHPEMPFRETLRWLKHATFGIAPYVWAVGGDYIAQSSLKLAQFAYLGKPAVTARFAVGDEPGRFGYDIGDTGSMVAATGAALAAAGTLAPRAFPTWDEVAAGVLDPPETLRLR